MVRLKDADGNQVFYYVNKFQFQYGSIKSGLIPPWCDAVNHFNSNMVRLKAAGNMIGLGININFNSNMVRLKETSLHFGECINDISIPIWFD